MERDHLTGEQRNTLNSLEAQGLAIKHIAFRPTDDYARIVARDKAGLAVDFAVDKRGRRLTEADLVALSEAQDAQWKAENGAFDAESRRVLASWNGFEALTAELWPTYVVPTEPLPPSNDEPITRQQAEELAEQWAIHRASLVEARSSAANNLAQIIQNHHGALLDVLSTDEGRVLIRTDRETLEQLARGNDVAAVSLTRDLLPGGKVGAQNGNIAINMDDLRQDPLGPWDGDGNGSKIRVGFYEKRAAGTTW